MNRTVFDIQLEILNFLNDGEYHSLLGTVLGVGNNFHLTKHEMDEIYEFVELNKKDIPVSSTKIHTQVRTQVSILRRAKFIKNFPNSEKIGFFRITGKGLIVLSKDKQEKQKFINSEVNKYKKLGSP